MKPHLKLKANGTYYFRAAKWRGFRGLINVLWVGPYDTAEEAYAAARRT